MGSQPLLSKTSSLVLALALSAPVGGIGIILLTSHGNNLAAWSMFALGEIKSARKVSARQEINLVLCPTVPSHTPIEGGTKQIFLREVVESKRLRRKKECPKSVPDAETAGQ